MPCTKVKGRTETVSLNIDSLVHAWFGRTSHQHYLQCLYSHDSLLTHVAATVYYLSCCSATLPPDCMHITTSSITDIVIHIVRVHSVYYFIYIDSIYF